MEVCGGFFVGGRMVNIKFSFDGKSFENGYTSEIKVKAPAGFIDKISAIVFNRLSAFGMQMVYGL